METKLFEKASETKGCKNQNGCKMIFTELRMEDTDGSISINPAGECVDGRV